MTNTTTTYSPTDMSALVTKAKAAFAKAVQSDRQAMILCANATFAVREAGLVGKGQSANGGWDSLRDYAGQYVGRSGNAVAASTVVLWTRLGRAISLGITEEAEPVAFGRIVQCYADKRVSEALDNGSKTAILKALKAIHGKDGKRIPAPKATAPSKPSTDKETDGLPVTRNTSTTLDAVEALLARITKVSKAERVRLVELVERIAVLYGDRADFASQVAEVLASSEANAA